jgi:hypothetical protein
MTLSAKVKVMMSVFGKSWFEELLPLLSDNPDFGMASKGISNFISSQIVGCGLCLLSSFSFSLGLLDY